MPLFTTDLMECSTLVHRVLRDEPPPTEVDAICFFGQTMENDRVALKAIAERWKRVPAQILVVRDCEPIDNGHFQVRGSDAWRNDLEKLGVSNNYIALFPRSKKLPPSTDAEAWGMVEFIKKIKAESGLSWSRLVVTVPPLHAIRAFVSLVSACMKGGLADVRIWSAPSETPSWDEEVCHSTGGLKASREKQIEVDYTKVSSYCLKGDHLTAKEVLAYFRRRRMATEPV